MLHSRQVVELAQYGKRAAYLVFANHFLATSGRDDLFEGLRNDSIVSARHDDAEHCHDDHLADTVGSCGRSDLVPIGNQDGFHSAQSVRETGWGFLAGRAM